MLYEVVEHFVINHEINEEMLILMINEVNDNIQLPLELNLIKQTMISLINFVFNLLPIRFVHSGNFLVAMDISVGLQEFQSDYRIESKLIKSFWAWFEIPIPLSFECLSPYFLVRQFVF